MLHLGISLEADNVRVAGGSVRGGQFFLSFLEDHPLVESEEKNRDSQITEIFQTIKGKYASQATKIYLCLPQEFGSVHKKIFPFKEKLKIKKNLEFEMSDEIIISEPVYGFKIVQFTTTAMTHVLVGALPKSVLESCRNQAEKAGLIFDGVISGGFSLSNFLENWHGKIPKVPIDEDADSLKVHFSELVLHLGENSTICLLKKQDGSVEDVSNITWGYNLLCKNLEKKFKLNPLEAEQYLSQSYVKTKSSTENKLYLQSLMSSLEDLSKSLHFKLADWKSKRFQVESIRITGKAAGIPQITEWLHEKLEIPTRILTWEESVSTRMNLEGDVQMNFSLAVGTCIESFKGVKNPPSSYELDSLKKEDSIQAFFKKQSFALFMVFFIFAIFLTHGFVREHLSRDLSSQAYSQMKKRAQAVGNITGVRGFRKKVMNFIKEKESVKTPEGNREKVLSSLSGLDVLKKVSQAINNSEIDRIYKIFIQDEKVHMRVFLKSPEAVSKLKRNLAPLSATNKVEESPLDKSDENEHYIHFKIKRLRK